MKSAVFVGNKAIQIENRLDCVPTGDEVLIQVAHVAICGYDQARFWDKEGGASQPVVLGHEFSGRIIRAPGASGLKTGQAVAVAPLLNCGTCQFCRAGKENLCRGRRLFGVAIDGALQEFVCLPADRVFPLPEAISLLEAALIEPLAVAYHAVRQAGTFKGKNALVLGAGAIGLLAAQVWRALGKGPVAILDINPQRLAIAQTLNIPVQSLSVVDQAYDVIFEATGSAQAFSSWLSCLAEEGKVVVVSKQPEPVMIDWISLLRKEGQISTSRYFTLSDFEASLKLVETGAVQLAPLVGKILPFQALADQAGQDVMRLAGQVVRLVISMDEKPPSIL